MPTSVSECLRYTVEAGRNEGFLCVVVDGSILLVSSLGFPKPSTRREPGHFATGRPLNMCDHRDLEDLVCS